MAGALCLLVRVLAVSFCLCLALATADAARFLAAAAAADGEADALLKLKAGIEDGGGALRSWSPGTSPCDGDASNWAGVMCSGGSVLGLQLEKMGLSGTLDLRPLSSLTSLRTLSFMDNKFAGPMPDVRELGGLRAIFLSGNKFSGEIPADAFAGMGWLKKVVLSRNSFSGAIPSSLTAVPRLLDLQLNDNKFQGKIPDFPQKDLKQFNVANNELEGEIPANLKSLGSEMFAGNDKLCGGPVEAKCEAASPPPVTSPAASDKIGASPSPPAATTTAAATTTTTTTGTAPTEDGTQQKPTEWSASFGVLAAFLGTVAIICFAVVALQRRREYNTENFGPTASTKPAMQSLPPSPAKTTHAAPRGSAAANDDRSSSAGGGSTVARGKAGEQGRLTFVRDDRGRFFELQDLLKATAEVLGSANLGVCYRATLTSGHSVVVKRFKEMNRVGKEDFEEHMRRLGRLSHPNLLPLIAYYYRKEEKLLIHDYAPNKSLAHLLHGEGKGIKKAVVHWAARVKLVKGVARALQYLYDELPMLTVPHGHLKASNILLDERFQPLLTDYALVPVMNQSHSAQLMVAFRSPERKQFGRSSKKSDVWCLGILILEILTGRPPSYEAAKPQQPPPPSDQPQPPPPENNLVGVVASTPEGEWLEAVVDADLRHEDDECKAEMVKLLKIGMACCETSVDSRWELKTAVDRIEELREGKEHANEDYSFYSSISDGAGRDDGDFANVAIN